MSFEAEDVLSGKYYSLWVAGDLMASVKTSSAEGTFKTEEVIIPGKLGIGTKITGVTGAGSFTCYKLFGDLSKAINTKLKAGKSFKFDLISELTDEDESDSERVIIEDCIITKFKVINIDTSKLLESSFDFVYNPDNVTYE
jgi:hypothetical protein